MQIENEFGKLVCGETEPFDGAKEILTRFENLILTRSCPCAREKRDNETRRREEKRRRKNTMFFAFSICVLLFEFSASVPLSIFFVSLT